MDGKRRHHFCFRSCMIGLNWLRGISMWMAELQSQPVILESIEWIIIFWVLLDRKACVPRLHALMCIGFGWMNQDKRENRSNPVISSWLVWHIYVSLAFILIVRIVFVDVMWMNAKLVPLAFLRLRWIIVVAHRSIKHSNWNLYMRATCSGSGSTATQSNEKETASFINYYYLLHPLTAGFVQIFYCSHYHHHHHHRRRRKICAEERRKVELERKTSI